MSRLLLIILIGCGTIEQTPKVKAFGNIGCTDSGKVMRYSDNWYVDESMKCCMNIAFKEDVLKQECMPSGVGVPVEG